MNYDQLVKALIASRLDHQRGLNYCDSIRVGGFPFMQHFVLSRNDVWVQDRIQQQALRIVSKDQGAQFFPVQPAVCLDDLFTKSFSDCAQSWRTWLDNFT